MKTLIENNLISATKESPEIVALWKKIMGLMLDECLWTTFGGENQYFIRQIDGKIILAEHGIYWKSNKVSYSYELSSPGSIVAMLNDNPEMFARSVHGSMTFYNNWTNFVDAFKVISEKEAKEKMRLS